MDKRVVNGSVVRLNNILPPKIILELKESCHKHFQNNLSQNSNNYYKITNCIVDCHGLHLTDSKIFPYSERCWNTFTVLVCNLVKNHFLSELYPELLVKKWKYQNQSMSGYQVFPHSCWAETVAKFKDNIRINFHKSRDPLFPSDKFITSFYSLENTDSNCGIFIKNTNDTYFHTKFPENSLTIFYDLPYSQNIPNQMNYQKTLIRFDFCVLMENHSVPWWLPSVCY